MRLAKTQISRGRSESSLCTQWVAKDPSFLHVASEEADAQADLSSLGTCLSGHFVSFVMRLLKCNINVSPIIAGFTCSSKSWRSLSQGFRSHAQAILKNSLLAVPQVG